MGYSKDQLLARLQELQIDFARCDHPVVMTVEEQSKHVKHLGGGISKNLFLKDKKHRFYIVSALSGTTVDLKVLSQRLGLGKGGLRMAPEEALHELLQVPLGCVTPFALINDSARNVSLLMDQGFRAQQCCLFHPLSNDVTISLKAQYLEKFLISIGKEASYVDLEAAATVGKDQPPDLAALVPDTPPTAPDTPEKPLSETNKQITEKSIKPSNNDAQSVTEKCAHNSVEDFVDQILHKTSCLVLSQITSETIEKHGEQLGGVVSDAIKKNLTRDLKSLSMMFKNAAYTEGRQSALQKDTHLMNYRCLP